VDSKQKKYKYTNHLAKESSPYLLMHAHNPVDWYPWGPEALGKAKKENKMIIISIGYAACHWCHVMEHESFDDEQVAEVMNRYFVSVKVDREERPDIDQVYMDAAQLLTGSGGWPLNAVTLPDGRPVFAGTYFPTDRWLMVLDKIRTLYEESPRQVEQQADSLTGGIRSAGMISLNDEESGFAPETHDEIFRQWQNRLDYQWGGEKRAPKFPLPVSYRYLMLYYYLSGNTNALEAVNVTLERMAMGGIYDQVGGGFARYSVDSHWRVPHFEKMLYDNGQLVSLYSKAYRLTKNPLFKSVVYDTLLFVEREMTAPESSRGGRGFYSSLDADSEGDEGKFYVWTLKEIREILGEDSRLIVDYYNITEAGNWENGNNTLFRLKSDESFAEVHKLRLEQLRAIIEKADAALLNARSRRERPLLDDKILTAWNALMLTGYVDAYRVFGEKEFLRKALSNGEFLVNSMMAEDGRLNRNYTNGKSGINAFLDDYAFTIEAFIALYQATFREKWLTAARKLLDYTLVHFFNKTGGMFYYTSDLDPALIARKMETTDNVIPSSNSQMGINLYLLGKYFHNDDYVQKARRMLNNIRGDLVRGGSYYANWSRLLAYFTHPPAEVAIMGEDWESIRKDLERHYLPDMILMGGTTEGTLPLLKDKLTEGQTTIYVCRNKACRLPVTEISKALEQLRR
jgi:uncharacterized protein